MRTTHQGTDHHNTNRKSVPQSPEANVTIDAAHSSAKCLTRLSIRVQLTNHDIGRVRYRSTQNTSEVTTRERNGSLSTLVVVGLLTWQIVVDHLNNSLEGSELHHRVGNLTAPQWVKTLVQTDLRVRRQRLGSRKEDDRCRTHPATPSLATTLEIPLKVPVISGGMVVWPRTLTDSNGHSAISAISSAEALAVR